MGYFCAYIWQLLHLNSWIEMLLLPCFNRFTLHGEISENDENCLSFTVIIEECTVLMFASFKHWWKVLHTFFLDMCCFPWVPLHLDIQDKWHLFKPVNWTVPVPSRAIDLDWTSSCLLGPRTLTDTHRNFSKLSRSFTLYWIKPAKVYICSQIWTRRCGRVISSTSSFRCLRLNVNQRLGLPVITGHMKEPQTAISDINQTLQ